MHTNKASHYRWVECVEKSVIVPVTLKYLKERKVNTTKFMINEGIDNELPSFREIG